MQNQGHSYSDIASARREMALFGIPSYVYQAWRAQFHSARKRGIPFTFRLATWHLWWRLELGKRGPGAKRGLRKGQFMMCRIGDQGAYEPGNVYCGTAADNQRDVIARDPGAKKRHMTAVWAARKARGVACHLAARGDGHPRSRAVVTPNGRYGSAALAAEVTGITRQAAAGRARAGALGWRYEGG